MEDHVRRELIEHPVDARGIDDVAFLDRYPPRDLLKSGERSLAPLDARHPPALLEEVLREVASCKTSDPGNQRFRHTIKSILSEGVATVKDSKSNK